MMPLWMTATLPVTSVCGCALRSVGPPWVAHRVCPMPVNPASGTSPESMYRSRLTSAPAFLAVCSDPSPSRIATPAES